MSAIIIETEALKKYRNTVVGYMKVNKTWTHHNNSFECAAWFEDSEIQCGVYPLILERNTLVPYDMRLVAKLKSIITSDYFPSLFGGVPVSNIPYNATRIGEERIVRHVVDIVDAINKTGNSSGESIDYYVNPEIWDLFIESARSNMSSNYQLLNEYHSRYSSEGDGSYDSNLSMISHVCGWISDLGKAIQEMKRRKSYLDNATDMMAQCYRKNMGWAVNQG